MRVPLSHIPLKKKKCNDNAAPKSPFPFSAYKLYLTKPKERSLLTPVLISNW